jgi:arabinose-5-phosphate isomerase
MASEAPDTGPSLQHDPADPMADAGAARASAAPSTDIAAARRVLGLEADALHALADALDDSFVAAIDTLAAVRGRVVVTGMGKSGHIARKMAATLASTGTPALYVHPGEASHGDLGMIAEGDAVIALSNSGNTHELSDTIAYCRRFEIPLIAITSGRDSTLSEQATCRLLLPAAQEACPMGLAPTTSTSMMLALGDALAVALLDRKGFRTDDFQLLHPGGALGKRLLRVSDLMHGAQELPLTHPDTPMSEAILTMTTRRFGCVGVTGDDGRLIGIVTDGDLRRHMQDGLLGLTAGEIMTRGPRTIDRQALAAEALGVMNRGPITVLFVVDQAGVPEGIIQIHDCLRAGVA